MTHPTRKIRDQGSRMYRVSPNDTLNQENQGSGIKDVQGII